MPANYPGILITLEGIEGVGKTTQLRFLAETLHQMDVPLLVTREPGGTPLADDIRHFLLSEHNETVEAETEALLMFAARAQHVSRVIRPALESGKLVLCDRFTDASYAYQGAGRGIPVEKIAILEKWVLNGLKPDVTLLLDAPVELSLTRIKERSKQDRFETETKKFFEEARQTYLDRAAAEPERFRILDATHDINKLREEILKIVKPYVEKIKTN